MIVITMMHSQLMQVRTRELPRTAAADPGIHFQGLLAVALLTLLPALPGGSDHIIKTTFIYLFCRHTTHLKHTGPVGYDSIPVPARAATVNRPNYRTLISNRTP